MKNYHYIRKNRKIKTIKSYSLFWVNTFWACASGSTPGNIWVFPLLAWRGPESQHHTRSKLRGTSREGLCQSLFGDRVLYSDSYSNLLSFVPYREGRMNYLKDRIRCKHCMMVYKVICWKSLRSTIEKKSMGPSRFELETSALSRRRHNQLDHRPSVQRRMLALCSCV